MGKYIIDIEVIDAEKRRLPSKHYVYVINVTWSDGSVLTVYRRYSRFFDLQTTLLDRFPIEGGTVDPEKRVIPFLPGKIFFGRSQIKDVAMKRLKEINDYCKKLIQLEPSISHCEEVLEYFEVEPEDLEPPKSTVSEGCPLYVDGAVIGGDGPIASKLKISKDKKAERISKPKRLDCYVAIASYMAQASGEITLQPGLKVEVLEKSDSGWWFVNSEDEQGWVPSTYLEPEEGGAPSSMQGPLAEPGQEENFICIEDFLAGSTDEVSLEKGSVVQVIQKNMDGWWLVRYNGKEAYAPGTVLKKVSNAQTISLVEKSRFSGVEIISSLQDVSTLLNHSAKGDSQLKQTSHAAGSRSSQISESKSAHDGRQSVILKQRSLERGGSLVPPPRQNSIMKSNVPDSPTRSNVYLTVVDFSDTVGDGLSYRKGQKVLVTEKSSTGWWYVTMGDKEGWVASAHLESYSGPLDSNPGYEVAPQSLITSINDEEYDYEDEDWYVAPDELPDQPEEVSNEDINMNRQAMPSLATGSDKITAGKTKPLPLPPAKKSEGALIFSEPGVKKIPDLPVKPNAKVPDPPVKPNAKVPDPSVKPNSKVPDPPVKPNAKVPDPPLKPNTKIPDPPIKPNAHIPTPPVKPNAVNPKTSELSQDNDLAGILKAKFEARSVGVSSTEDTPKNAGTKFKPNFLKHESQDPRPQPLPGTAEARPVLKPPPPAKLKQPTGNSTKPIGWSKPAPVSTTKPNLPVFPHKAAGSNPENNNILEKEKDTNQNKFSNVKSMSAAFNPAANLKSVEKPLTGKPPPPGKPKPSMTPKPNLANPTNSGHQISGQCVSNLASSLSGKLHFGQTAKGNHVSESEKNPRETSSQMPPPPPPPSKPSVAPQSAAQISTSSCTPLSNLYIATCDFVAENEGELGFSEGDEVEMLEEQGDWCRIRCWDEEGWAPTNYVQKI